MSLTIAGAMLIHDPDISRLLFVLDVCPRHPTKRDSWCLLGAQAKCPKEKLQGQRLVIACDEGSGSRALSQARVLHCTLILGFLESE